MAGVNDLQALAAEYLAACVAALELAPGGVPPIAFVSQGPPAWDCCPMLAVHVGVAQPYPTNAGPGALASAHRMVLAGILPAITMTATVLRCAASGKTPSDAAKTAAAAESNGDLWAIWNWLVNRKADGTLFAGLCRETAIGQASALSVQGLCGGWQIPIQVELDGYTIAAPEL